jgi:hypothetical protein
MEEEEIQEQTTKKRIADRIIKVYPQDQLARGTAFFDDHRFLHISLHGYII